MSEKTNRYEKLGGWLLCVVILFFSLLILGIVLQFGEGGVMDIIRRWDMFVGGQGWLLLAQQVSAMLLAVIYAFTAAAVVQRDPHFLRTRQLAFAVIAVNLLLQLVYGLAYGFAESGRLVLLFQAAGYALLLGLAMLYYARSARVRAYMGSDEYLQLAFFTKFFTKKEREKAEEGDSK